MARGRIYFRAAQGSSFYYVEMTQEPGRFFGKLPRPRVEASPITYYLQATTTEFEESQTPEIEAIVVEKKEDCGDRKVAAYGPPGEVTVFSAATGAAISPAGFAAGGAAIAAGTHRAGRRWSGRRGHRRGRHHEPAAADAVSHPHPDAGADPHPDADSSAHPDPQLDADSLHQAALRDATLSDRLSLIGLRRSGEIIIRRARTMVTTPPAAHAGRDRGGRG